MGANKYVFRIPDTLLDHLEPLKFIDHQGGSQVSWCPQTFCLLVYNPINSLDISTISPNVKLELFAPTYIAIELGHHLAGLFVVL